MELFPFGQGHEFFQKLDVVGKAAGFLNAKGLMEELPEVAVPVEVDVAPGPVGTPRCWANWVRRRISDS